MQSLESLDYFIKHPSEYLGLITVLSTIIIAVTIYCMERNIERKYHNAKQAHARGVFFDTILLAIKQVQNYAKDSIYDRDEQKRVKTVIQHASHANNSDNLI